ncbi:MAG TPA: hypothetical protein VN634_18365 [Candidatus Limnocylindrales bacterium]|nr:hypothetical protein [Candidatus Limnocylindrales bacterium]
MNNLLRGALVAALVVAVHSMHQPAAMAQPANAPLPAAPHDCSRWPASVYDEATGTCLCAQGLWWNLRGDACLPKEHAAGEFCGTVWPGSQPLFTSGGGYRCVCIPPLMWDSQATACRAPMVDGAEDCLREWPGTLPVLSPSGTEFECRCPGGRRWDDGRRNCVDGAPVVSVARGFFVPDSAVPPIGNEVPPAPPFPGNAAPPAPPSSEEPLPRGGADLAPGGENALPRAGERETEPPRAGTDYPRGPATAARPPAPTYEAPPRGSSATCDALLAEIRARAAAGQASQADSLGMKAAVSGCDPKAIADAAHVKSSR